jgi:sulfite exporter TauE/SafE/copper chaperone CopZ
MSEIKSISVIGMQCAGCEAIIEEALAKCEGVESVKVSYANAKVEVCFDVNKLEITQIHKIIEDSGYKVELSVAVKKRSWLKIALSLIALAGIIAIMVFSRKIWHQFSLPEIDSQLSDGMIFVVGLITGLHCIGMCGGFVINYTAKDTEQGQSSYLSHFLYGIGKTLSYAMFGAFFGFVGSIVSITPFIKGVSAICAGLFLIVFGLNMLNIFAPLKRFRFKQPEAMARFAIEKRRQSKSPFFIGFFSGFLLGCGPLQAMYVLAAGNGDPLQGAKILALFGLGTLPALLSFGLLAKILSEKMTRRFLQASGIILLFIGSMMLNKGLIRTESGYDFKTVGEKVILTLDSIQMENSSD